MKQEATICKPNDTKYRNSATSVLTLYLSSFSTINSWSFQWNCCHLSDRPGYLILSQERKPCQMAEESNQDRGQVVDRHPLTCWLSADSMACRQLTGRSPANGLPEVLNIYTAWTQAVSRGLWLS